jgi:hypothetical protein
LPVIEVLESPVAVFVLVYMSDRQSYLAISSTAFGAPGEKHSIERLLQDDSITDLFSIRTSKDGSKPASSAIHPFRQIQIIHPSDTIISLFRSSISGRQDVRDAKRSFSFLCNWPDIGVSLFQKFARQCQ